MDAMEIERAGRAYLLNFRKLNMMNVQSGKLAWIITPKWHVPWLLGGLFEQRFWFRTCANIMYLGSPDHLQNMITQRRNTITPLTIFIYVCPRIAKAFCHVLHDLVKTARLNPRYFHTFTDEDSMSNLKKWSRKSDGRLREFDVSRLFRMRLKTLKWRLADINRTKKRRWKNMVWESIG